MRIAQPFIAFSVNKITRSYHAPTVRNWNWPSALQGTSVARARLDHIGNLTKDLDSSSSCIIYKPRLCKRCGWLEVYQRWPPVHEWIICWMTMSQADCSSVIFLQKPSLCLLQLVAYIFWGSRSWCWESTCKLRHPSSWGLTTKHHFNELAMKWHL